MSQTTNKYMTLKQWGFMFALSIIWGGSYFFIKIALTDITPFTLVFLRLALGTLALNIILFFLKLPLPRDPKIWLAFVGMGILNNALPFSLITYGQTQISSGLASIMNATVPLFTIVVAHFFAADEKATKMRVTGVITGFIGIIVMIGPDALKGLGKDVLGQIACLMAALSYAFAGFYGKRFKAMGIKPMVTATGQVTVSAIIMLFFALVFDKPWTLGMPSAQSWVAVLCLGIFSTAIAYTLYFKLLASVGASNLMLVTFLIPVTAILLGIMVLGETLQSAELIGMGLIALGLVAIDGRIFKKNLAQSPNFR